MAIYHLAVKHASRSQGRSALAHANYIAREGPYAQGRFAEQFVQVEHCNMPAWAQENPHAFWAAADTYERANGRLYTELEIALPRELSHADQAALARSFIASQIGTEHPCSWALHVSHALDGGEQPHAHVMFSERTHDGIARGPDLFFRRANPAAPALGGAAKDPAWNHRDKVEELRVAWAETANRALERAGLEARIDHRSLEAQGIDRLPEPKLGPERTALLRRGIATPESAQVLDLRAYRARLGRVDQAVERTQGQVIDFTQARAAREAQARAQAARQAQELAREREQAERHAHEQARAREAQEPEPQAHAREREAQEDTRESQAREPAAREAQERSSSDHLTPEEAARVEALLAREPAWRAAHEEARLAQLLGQVPDPEARLAAVLARATLWHAAQLGQARQQLERATGQAHTFAHAGRVTGRLLDRVELAQEDFGRVLDRDGHVVLVPWTRVLTPHLERAVAIDLDAAQQVTRVLAVAPPRAPTRELEWRRERGQDRGLDLGG
jgi:hypothetical protein